MSRWRDSEKYFVTALLDVYSVVDLSSYPLKVVRRTDVRYNGPKDEDYKSLLFKNDLAANHAGRAIVRARKHDNPEEDDYFLVERMVEQVEELDCLLKENGVQGVKELKSLLDGTWRAELVKQQEAELGKKDAELAKKEADLAAKDADLAKKDIELTRNRGELARNRVNLAIKDADLAKKDSELAKNKDAELAKIKADLAKMAAAHPRALKQVSLGGDFVEFFRRMSRTYVNQEEKYINLSFTGTMYPGIPDHEDVFVVRYYDKDRQIAQPFSMVQFDLAENPRDELGQVKVSEFNYQATFSHRASASAIVDNPSDNDCAFLYSYVCFVGRIRRVLNGNFRNNAAVSTFFQKSLHGKDCYVDEVGSTFFVLSRDAEWYKYTDERKAVPTLLTN